MPETPIPGDVALAICEKLQKDIGRRVFSQCWGCVRFSKGDFSRMCAGSKPDHRGCRLVNKEFDRGSH